MRSQIRSLSHLNFRFQSRKSFGLIPSNNLAATRYLLYRGFRTASSLSSSLPFFKLSHARLSLSQSAQTSLRKSKLKNGNTDRDVEISWTIDDAGKEQCWAIVGPASEKAAMVKKGLVQLLSGQSRPKTGKHSTKASSNHPSAHPFLSQSSAHPSQVIQHVSFSTRLSNSNSSSSGFQDFSVRYGAIREDEDKITLFESLMNNLGCKVGNIAKKSLVPDPLSQEHPTTFLSDERDQSSNPGTLSQSSRFKWESRESYEQSRKRAEGLQKKVFQVAGLLDLGPELLNRPLIALSNGQTRRARISSALLGGSSICEALILSEPYTGLDVKTRKSISSLLGRLHSERNPRVVLVLREQDEIPSFVTHVLGIEEDGRIGFSGRRDDWDEKSKKIEGARNVDANFNQNQHSSRKSSDAADSVMPAIGSKGGLERVKENSKIGLGRGDESKQPIVDMRGLTIKYGDKKVLDNVDFVLPPSSTLILAGANGSGKTTLLSLILGDHPKSYSFPASTLSLFGDKRSSPSNSTANLLRKIGHLSPELFNSFPRKSLEYGGMRVVDCIGSGFEGVFCRRALDQKQRKRVRGLIGIFRDLITSTGQSQSVSNKNDDPQQTSEEMEKQVEEISNLPFVSLSSGSQATVLFLRSIVHSPKLLVLDEPFQGMDSRQVERVRAYLDSRNLTSGRKFEDLEFCVGDSQEKKMEDEKNRQEMSLVLVSHYEQEYPVSAGRLVRLEEGKVVELI